MGVPVHTLNKEQKVWYARFVIGAILADDEISPSEVDFLKQVISIVDSPDDKKELMQLISVKKRPPLTPPKGISKEVLAAIFIELILIMISDLDFADKEKEYLKEVSQLFNFSDAYFNELMSWGETGLDWKSSQRYLIAEDGKVASFSVPLDKLNPDQKKWYAYVLIATIMLDGMVEDTELQFLKAAMCILNNKKDQQQLVGYVRNKMVPPLTEPTGIPDKMLRLIFFEVILIVSADESLSYKEQTHLKNIASLCSFPKEFLEKAIEWCNQGISWKQTKNPLIARCKFSATSTNLQAQGPLEVHPENNSVLFRDLECFICESSKKTKGYQLKPHSQEPNRNIFGITTYLESLGDQDYIDFNRIKVFVCPNCFFASTEKNLFKKNKGENPPSALSGKKFKDLWMKNVSQRKSLMAKCSKEIGSLKRSIPTIEKTYQLSIQSAQTLATTTNDQSYSWQAVTLKLTLAEIMMSNGDEAKADEYLEEARQAAEELFRSASNNLVAIRSARLLFYIALYNNDVRTAGPFVDYIRNLYQDDSGSLNANESAILRKVFGETQNALKNRPDYKKENLMGYHLDI
ncbi:TerB family tellurite resistance protein [bacterium]|nr:TerB family tellurite resistance protein [bacterium]